MNRIGTLQPVNAIIDRLDATVTPWLARHSVGLLRMSLGFVFLAFGVLKFFPDVSPAESITKETIDGLSFGLVPGGLAMVLVAMMETAIGLSLLTGRYLRVGIGLLGLAMVGVLSPLALLPGELFSGRYNAPTIVGQYVIKDVVLLSAALVVGVRERGAELMLVAGRPAAA